MSMIGDFLRARRKRRSIAAYLRRLPAQLRHDYGPADRYTPAQVRASIGRAGLDETCSCYAEAMYCGAEAFGADHAERGEFCDYEAMRAEVSTAHLGGHGLPTPGEALAASESAHSGGAGSGHHGHHGDGGSHGGFEGGHGGW